MQMEGSCRTPGRACVCMGGGVMQLSCRVVAAVAVMVVMQRRVAALRQPRRVRAYSSLLFQPHVGLCHLLGFFLPQDFFFLPHFFLPHGCAGGAGGGCGGETPPFFQM